MNLFRISIVAGYTDSEEKLPWRKSLYTLGNSIEEVLVRASKNFEVLEIDLIGKITEL